MLMKKSISKGKWQVTTSEQVIAGQVKFGAKRRKLKVLLDLRQ